MKPCVCAIWVSFMLPPLSPRLKSHNRSRHAWIFSNSNEHCFIGVKYSTAVKGNLSWMQVLERWGEWSNFYLNKVDNADGENSWDTNVAFSSHQKCGSSDQHMLVSTCVVSGDHHILYLLVITISFIPYWSPYLVSPTDHHILYLLVITMCCIS